MHDTLLVLIASDFPYWSSVAYLIVGNTQTWEFPVQECGNETEREMATYGIDCLTPQKDIDLIGPQHISYGESFDGRQMIRIIGHVIPEDPTSHHSSFLVC